LKHRLIACLILGLAALPRLCTAQSTAVQKSNARMMDSLEMEVITIWCRGQLDFPAKYNRHKTDKVVHVLRTLNSLYTDTLTRSGLITGINNFNEKRISIDTIQNGGDTLTVNVRVRLPEYLDARLTFVCAGEHVVSQRYELQPETKIWSDNHDKGYVDFNYCKTVYAPALNFPVQYVRNEYFVALLGL
jgi:hypothetical protein